ncbi:hypothetical protein [Streptomyces sp. NBC_00696]|uniref:hypothetical protein n=1 Tax=Streptomyces sp. NBC_00696 TaxID=2903672 RepID=UPI002E2ED608|nr:hypothetical protein [Streptomyces sp. NBC_00696]
MPRTNPSALERALVAAVGQLGRTITQTQLERWRTNLWLARTADWTDPDTGELRPEIVHRAARLADASTPGRSISWLGWIFWAIDDTPETAARLREAVVKALQRPFQRAGVDFTQVPEGDSDDAFEARQEMAAAMLKDRRSPRKDFDGTLRAGAAEAEFDLPPSRSVTNILHQALMDPGARMLLGGADDVGFEELMEAFEAASPDNTETIGHLRAAHREAALAGVDLLAESPLAGGLRGLVRAVQEADDRTLCAAVRTCTKGNGALTILLLQRAPSEPEILRTLMADVMWDQWARIGGCAPVLGLGGEAAIAINVVQYLVIPGWAEDLERYQALMDTLLAQPVA